MSNFCLKWGQGFKAPAAQLSHTSLECPPPRHRGVVQYTCTVTARINHVAIRKDPKMHHI